MLSLFAVVLVALAATCVDCECLYPELVPGGYSQPGPVDPEIDLDAVLEPPSGVTYVAEKQRTQLLSGGAKNYIIKVGNVLDCLTVGLVTKGLFQAQKSPGDEYVMVYATMSAGPEKQLDVKEVKEVMANACMTPL